MVLYETERDCLKGETSTIVLGKRKFATVLHIPFIRKNEKFLAKKLIPLPMKIGDEWFMLKED